MSRTTFLAGLAGLAVLGLGDARADAPLPLTDGEPLPASGPRGHHQGQFGLSASLATGYRFIATYDAQRFCGDRASVGDGGGNAAYCFSRTPLSLDLTFSYGLTRSIELMLDIRLGLERDFGTSSTTEGPRLRHYAPGVRFVLGGSGQATYFSTLQLAIDTTGYSDGMDDLGTDLRLRNANGLQVDFHDAYGVFVYFGEELAFRRWFELGLEAGVGIQGRYP